jgi:hypothetical protein
LPISAATLNPAVSRCEGLTCCAGESCSRSHAVRLTPAPLGMPGLRTGGTARRSRGANAAGTAGHTRLQWNYRAENTETSNQGQCCISAGRFRPASRISRSFTSPDEDNGVACPSTAIWPLRNQSPAPGARGPGCGTTEPLPRQGPECKRTGAPIASAIPPRLPDSWRSRPAQETACGCALPGQAD